MVNLRHVRLRAPRYPCYRRCHRYSSLAALCLLPRNTAHRLPTFFLPSKGGQYLLHACYASTRIFDKKSFETGLQRRVRIFIYEVNKNGDGVSTALFFQKCLYQEPATGTNIRTKRRRREEFGKLKKSGEAFLKNANAGV